MSAHRPDGIRTIGDSIEVANEFTLVSVTKVRTHAGERLLVKSPRLGFEVLLDPLQLESLTWQQPELFSQLLEKPFGPGVEMKARPLSDLI
ncbi:MAG: dihydrodiol dehydrogenase [Rhodococcus sp. (in: high G+C Gram-positive bacteria)]|uniref:dihydrodiol dehydrogenase n=1 Tax=Rhodococcus sp. TaxID=1831 RepID=UPI002AD87803|nr:dihydrodiol dehydrogenase [Rhodococcus sp. (in: high G+C Gram-positive bacteria)]